MVAALRETRVCAAGISEEAPEPIERPIATGDAGGANALVVCTDPVDGSSNLDVNGSVGTIFAVRASEGKRPAGPAALGPGTRQLGAGSVMYGPATMLVYTLGQGAPGFTPNPESGEFLLTHPYTPIPPRRKPYGPTPRRAHSL